MREWVTVLWARLVEIREVDAYAPFAVFLFDDNRVSQPFGVSDFGNETRVEEPVDFFVYGFRTFWTEFSLLLSDGFERRVDVQFMGGNCGVDPLHVGSLLGERRGVVFDERDDP